MRHRDDQRRDVGIDRVRQEQRRRQARRSCGSEPRRALHAGRETPAATRPARACGGRDRSAAASPIRSPSLDEVDAADQRRRGRRRRASERTRRERRGGIGSSRSRIHVERDVDARQLGVELLRELRRARAQARAHPLALGLADFAEPAVLQRRQRGEQHEQDRGGQAAARECGARGPLYAKDRGRIARFTFLTKRLPRDNNFLAGASSYSSNEAGGVLQGVTMQRLIVSLISLAMTLGGFAARAAGDTKAEQLLAQARAALGGDKQPDQGAGADGDRHVSARDGRSAVERRDHDRSAAARQDAAHREHEADGRRARSRPMQGINGDQVLRNSRTHRRRAGHDGPHRRRRAAPTAKRRRCATSAPTWRASRSRSC